MNRGLFVCDECCSIHRSLGRHISQIKYLNADWCPTTLSVNNYLIYYSLLFIFILYK